MAIPGIKAFYTESENPFNGEPQVEAKRGNEASGLPLNDEDDSPRSKLKETQLTGRNRRKSVQFE